MDDLRLKRLTMKDKVLTTMIQHQNISGFDDYLPERPEELYFSLPKHFGIDEDEL